MLLAAACAAKPGAREAYLRFVTAAEAPLEQAWRRFDAAVARSDWSAARGAAADASAAASRARDCLEGIRVPPPLEAALREELIFLNHVVPAYRGFAAGEANTAGVERLQSILRRGRIHQKRGRDAVR